MTKIENLLTILAEECAETAHRVSKAIRFTPEEVQPGQDLSNAERIAQEFNDIVAVMELLHDEGIVPYVLNSRSVIAKKEKIAKYLRYSQELGTIQ